MLPVCPKCDLALIVLDYKDIEIDFCIQCKGLWLDAGELESLVENSPSPLDMQLNQALTETVKTSKQHKNLCPRCDRKLQEIRLEKSTGGQLVLDRCPNHDGLWFDSNELQALLQMFSKSHENSAAIEFFNDLLTQPNKS